MAARIASTVLLLLALVAVMPAHAQEIGPAVETLADEVFYVESGVDPGSVSTLLDAVERAADQGVDLRIAVFAGAGDAQALASDIAAQLGSVTVLVFTTDSYGVFSDELAQGRLDDALSAAEDDLSGSLAADGAAAFADGLDPDSGGISAGLVAVGVILLLGVVGIGGRLWEVKTRDARQARRRDRRRTELMDRTRRIADRVLVLSDPVELADDSGLSKQFAAATARFNEAEVAIAGATTMHELDDVEGRLAEAEQLLGTIKDRLDKT
ncbi:MAG: hypothetical protein HKO82_00755 [Acidimicrobiia bacterium]|nr:hypothetical protein [Acidimicrobiia bacterium]